MQRKSMLEANSLQLETGGVIIRDSTINFNTGSVTRGLPVLLNVIDSSTGDERPSLSELGQEFLLRDHGCFGIQRGDLLSVLALLP
jgi:hypothetical protein